MNLKVVGDKQTGWELIGDDVEPIGIAENMSYLSAIDAFCANWPEYMDQLDQLRTDYIDLVGEAVAEKKKRLISGMRQPRERKRGVGNRFVELILAGKSNVECLRIVMAEFPESKATLSDAAWQRSQLRKSNPGL